MSNQPTQVIFDPWDTYVAATDEGPVFISFDGGATQEDLSESLPYRARVIIPIHDPNKAGGRVVEALIEAGSDPEKPHARISSTNRRSSSSPPSLHGVIRAGQTPRSVFRESVVDVLVSGRTPGSREAANP
ncbi:MAG TPA: hypothetical protein VMY37_37465 [Thermoguttaceae bacterium]|nr:hypothetical protein [Thermoguttaceae bacterium]